MNYKQLRNLVFPLHRYIGLVAGLIAIVIGLTGSLLVFYHEMDHSLIRLHTGPIVPQENRVSIETVLDTVKAAYVDRPELKLSGIQVPLEPDVPYEVGLESPDETYTQAFVNPYTGNILFSRVWNTSLFGIVYELHYKLLAGRAGEIVAGVAALLMLILSITGLILWPGWRKLITGFKIKWQAHIKRVNFDIHKVIGLIAVVFLAMISFTGFCWNFYDFSYPVIYAATFSPKPPEPVSKPIAGKLPLNVDQILQKADAALPGATTTYISLPTEKEGIFRVSKKFPQDVEDYQNRIYLDQYSGEVLWLKDSRQQQPLGERFIDTFGPVHFGTFGGVPTRIFYVFIGLTPLILTVTGFVMWQYRYRGKAQIKREVRTHPKLRRMFSIKRSSNMRHESRRNL